MKGYRVCVQERDGELHSVFASGVWRATYKPGVPTTYQQGKGMFLRELRDAIAFVNTFAFTQKNMVIFSCVASNARKATSICYSTDSFDLDWWWGNPRRHQIDSIVPPTGTYYAKSITILERVTGREYRDGKGEG